MHYTNRIRFHCAAQQEYRQTIARLYGLLPQECAMPESIRQDFAREFETLIKENESWKITKQLAAKHSRLTLAAIDTKLDMLAKIVSLAYADACFLHGTIHRSRPDAPEIYRPETFEHPLAHTLKNHIFNEFDLRLRELGLDDTSAYLLQSKIIACTIHVAEQKVPDYEGELNFYPSRDYTDRKHEPDVIERNIKSAHSYWIEESEKIHNRRLTYPDIATGISR